MIKKLVFFYDRFEEIFLAICTAAMVLIVFLQIVMRFIFNNSLTWSEELATVIFIWISWIGISLGEKKGEHIRITLVTDRFHGNAKKVIIIIGNLCTLAILVFLLIYGIDVMMHIMSIGSATPALKIPKWIVYGAVPVSSFLMGVRVIKGTWDILTNKKEELFT